MIKTAKTALDKEGNQADFSWEKHLAHYAKINEGFDVFNNYDKATFDQWIKEMKAMGF